MRSWFWNNTEFAVLIIDMEQTEFELHKHEYRKSWRGSYLIIPVRLKYEMNFELNHFAKKEFRFEDELSDKSDLIIARCKSDYINRYILSDIEFKITVSDQLTLSDFQLYLFENGIGFITVFTFCENSKVNLLYKLVNNGYIGSQVEEDIYGLLYDKLSEILDPSNLEIIVKNKSILLNESYVLNLALVPERFEDLETIEQLTLNVHKQIDLSEDFTDHSERDIRYAYGARDVDLKTYRWGCCVSTLGISYVYQNKLLSDSEQQRSPEEIHSEMLRTSASDLLLTILVLIQKYTCMQLNENIHEEIYKKRFEKSLISRNVIQKLKHRVLEFRAFGTLAPSQVSRWNNVCDIYRELLEVLGINEALREIEEKIDLLNAEQEQRSADSTNSLSLLIAIFGLISIVASVLTIVDLVTSASSAIVIALVLSVVAILIVGLVWIIKLFQS